MDSPQAEQDVVRGLRDGRPEAWRALYDAYARRVWHAVARQMGPNAADVGDVVQETFLAAARSARRYDPARGSLWMWLCGIARRHVALQYRNQRRHDRLRRETRELAAVGRQTVRWLEDSAPGPGEMAMQSELAGLVRAVLTELPVDYEILLTAKYFDGMSIEELVVQEDCSATAVRSKLARARRTFRDAFCKRVNL
jgi:RNA polymerase sigma-70 factor (ECF subfamily)